MMQPVTVGQVAQVAPIRQPDVKEGYYTSASKCLGGVQIFIGATCIIAHVAAIIVKAGMYFVGHGIWCGIFFLLTGIFGVLAANKKTAYINTFLITSILSASFFSVALITCAALGLVSSRDYYGYSRYGYSSYGYSSYYSQLEARVALNGLLLALGLLEGVIAIISSAICCRSTCSQGTTQVRTYDQGYVRYDSNTGQQVIILPMTVPMQQQQNLVPGGMPYMIQQPAAYTMQTGTHVQGQQPIQQPAVASPPAYYSTGMAQSPEAEQPPEKQQC